MNVIPGCLIVTKNNRPQIDKTVALFGTNTALISYQRLPYRSRDVAAGLSDSRELQIVDKQR